MPEKRPAKSYLKKMSDLLLLVAIVAVAIAIVVAVMDRGQLKSEIQIVAQEAQRLQAAFEEFYEQNQAYPNRYRDPGFGLLSLDPLRERGYYHGFLPARLHAERADEYDSPDDQGLNQEFWLELTLERDPRIRFLIAKSDDAPLSGGKWCDGVFIYRRGVLEKL